MNARKRAADHKLDENFRTLQLAAIGYCSFCMAADAFENLFNYNRMGDSFARPALVAGAVTSYARPFVKMKGIGKIYPLSEVPEEFEEHHNRIMDFRHHVFAHTDAEEKVEGTGEHFNRVQIVLRSGKPSLGLGFHSPHREDFDQFRELARHMQGKALSLFNKTQEEISLFKDLPDGTYLLNWSDGNPLRFLSRNLA